MHFFFCTIILYLICIQQFYFSQNKNHLLQEHSSQRRRRLSPRRVGSAASCSPPPTKARTQDFCVQIASDLELIHSGPGLPLFRDKYSEILCFCYFNAKLGGGGRKCPTKGTESRTNCPYKTVKIETAYIDLKYLLKNI